MKSSKRTPEAINLRSLAEKALSQRPPKDGKPEVDVHRLLHELQVHQIELEMQNEELRRAWEAAEKAFGRYAELYDLAPIAYFAFDCAGEIRHVNIAGAALLGQDRSKLSSRRFGQFVADKDRTAFNDFLMRVFAGEDKETCEILLAGIELPHHVLIEASKGESGQTCRAAVIDISGRKQAEEQRLAHAVRQRDVLVREVHHRIKNHLQGAIGLLRQQTEASPELKTPLDAAINQLSALAVTHGMQCGSVGAAPLLCETVGEICRTLQGQSGRAIDWQTDNAGKGFRPVNIAEKEAVPIALVVNELVWNALKHSADAPPGSQTPAVSVRMTADGQSACLRIRNRLREDAAGFDYAKGRGLGAGLQLVRALLPLQGARFFYTTAGPLEIQAELHLGDPVILPAATED